MATINNIYVWVEKEDLSSSTNITQHPVEKGLPTTDTARDEPKSISITGKIVDYENVEADNVITKLENLKKKKSLIKYNGKLKANDGNYLIKSFNYSYSKETWGGADFDMELLEVRIAKSAYSPKKKTKQKAKEKAKKKNNPTLKVGAKVVFKGGNVYVSSDASKPAAKRGRSTCKITIISKASWSKHQYHLISTDGKMVYGWCDKKDIEGTGSSGTSSKTNGGTKQTKKK